MKLLVKKLANENNDFNEKELKIIIKAIFDEIKMETLKNYNGITIPNFGTFYIENRIFKNGLGKNKIFEKRMFKYKLSDNLIKKINNIPIDRSNERKEKKIAKNLAKKINLQKFNEKILIKIVNDIFNEVVSITLSGKKVVITNFGTFLIENRFYKNSFGNGKTIDKKIFKFKLSENLDCDINGKPRKHILRKKKGK